MVKIDWEKFIDYHMWFGWARVRMPDGDILGKPVRPLWVRSPLKWQQRTPVINMATSELGQKMFESFGGSERFGAENGKVVYRKIE